MIKWPQQQLQTLAEVKHGFAFKSDFFDSVGKYVLLTPGNFREEGGFRWLGEKQKHYSGDVPRGYVLKEDDLLVAMTEQAPGLLGSAILIPENNRYLHNQRLGLLQVRSLKLSKHFLYHVFNSRIVRKPISETSAGTKVKHTSPEKIGKLSIPVPPMEQQTAISDSLSTWDSAIERTERLITAKEKRLKGLAQELIMAPSRISGHWEHSRICDIAKRIQRRSDGNALPILTISSSSGFVLQEEKYSRYMAGESVKSYILLRKGEFAYNKGNSLRYQFGCVFELKDYKEALVPHVYVCFKPNAEVDPDYLGHLFAADYLHRQLRALVKTGVRNNGPLNIKPDEFMNVMVPVPPIGRQKQIAEILNNARKEVDLLKKRVELLRRQKRGLMQKLLTGQWRVKVKGSVIA